MGKITIYAINLPKRKERKKHIIDQFDDKNEFKLEIVIPVPDKNPAKSLWRTIKKIVADKYSDDFVIICEDDHQFTEAYSFENFLFLIKSVIDKNADVLLGGVSSFQNGFPISDNLFMIDEFSGTQFVIVFKQFYNKILEADFSEFDTADYIISALTDKKFVVYPFISVQKEFGYSDATSKNNLSGRVEQLFRDTSDNMKSLKNIRLYFKESVDRIQQSDYSNIDLAKVCISTYLVNLKSRPDRLAHVKAEFKNKPEFDITVVEAIKHEVGAVGLWLSIRKIIETAIGNDDDVIIICEDDHEFTGYDRDQFLRNIILAQQLGAEYLSGGCSHFEHAIPVTPNLYWVSFCQATQLIILYKPVFKKILNEPYDNSVIGDLLLSKMISNKMILYPGISVQKNFGYSDVTSVHNENKDLITDMFSRTKVRLDRINKMAVEHGCFLVKN